MSSTCQDFYCSTFNIQQGNSVKTATNQEESNHRSLTVFYSEEFKTVKKCTAIKRNHSSTDTGKRRQQLLSFYVVSVFVSWCYLIFQ